MKKLFFLSTILLLGQVATAAAICNDAILASTPDSRFTVSSNEVTDTQTGLVWQRCSLGLSGSFCTTGTAAVPNWQQALQAADAERTTTGLPWRVPNIKELHSITEVKCFNPAINEAIFPNTYASYYWSASPYANNASDAWGVYFGNGYSDGYGKSNGRYVRLVRGGQ